MSDFTSDYYGLPADERAEVDRIKWLESERRGHDIGLYYAHWIWLTTERKRWLAQRVAYQSSGHQS